ncbi:MAG TPA: hypothetical protein VE029_01955 [Rhizobacter sp.]|nr:hypothetical protein [Rhizobacter sp.]
MSRIQRLASFSSGMLLVTLAACGGGDSTIGGTLSGLPAANSVTLQNNGTDDLTLTANGAFTFSKAVAKDSTYSVSVLTQPVAATCTVANGGGSTDSNGSDISNVSVSCAITASIAGSVTGLASGAAVTLSNAGVLLTVASNGPFAFPGIKTAGTAYNVSVSTQPAGGQTCSVTNGSGSVVANTQTAITVSCI